MVSAWPRGDHDEEVEEEDEEEEEEERPEKAEVRLVTTRRVAAGDSLEVRENYTNAERLYKYGFVERDRRKERSPFTFEVWCSKLSTQACHTCICRSVLENENEATTSHVIFEVF